MIYNLDEFDCDVFIPDLDNFVMVDNDLVLPPHLFKMLNKKREHELVAGNVALTPEDRLLS